MVVTEMNTPIKVLDLASVSETTPTTPAPRTTQTAPPGEPAPRSAPSQTTTSP